MSSTDPATPRKLKRLWIAMALAALVVLFTPLFLMLAGVPSFGFAITVTSSAVTFVLLVPAFWAALSPRLQVVTGSWAFVIVAAIVLLLGFVLWLHPWSLHT